MFYWLKEWKLRCRPAVSLHSLHWDHYVKVPVPSPPHVVTHYHTHWNTVIDHSYDTWKQWGLKFPKLPNETQWKNVKLAVVTMPMCQWLPPWKCQWCRLRTARMVSATGTICGHIPSISIAVMCVEPVAHGGLHSHGDTPKWMVYKGKSYWNGWFGGTPPF